MSIYLGWCGLGAGVARASIGAVMHCDCPDKAVGMGEHRRIL